MPNRPGSDVGCSKIPLARFVGMIDPLEIPKQQNKAIHLVLKRQQ
jgi:hypothetical protein